MRNLKLNNIGYNQLVTVSRIIKELLEDKSKNIESHHLWIKTYCPYTFGYSSIEGHVLPQNREYLPLGIFPYKPGFAKEGIELYRQFQSVSENLIDLNSCPKQITCPNSDEIQYYLYHDGNSPWYDKQCLKIYYDALCKLIKQ